MLDAGDKISRVSTAPIGELVENSGGEFGCGTNSGKLWSSSKSSRSPDGLYESSISSSDGLSTLDFCPLEVLDRLLMASRAAKSAGAIENNFPAPLLKVSAVS